MQEFLDSMAFRVFAAVSAALVLKLVGLAYLTGIGRMREQGYANPEDAKLFKGQTGEQEFTQRVQRAHRNSLENEPLFILLGLLWVFLGAHTGTIQIYAYTFFFARVVHSLTYLLKLQPWRTLSYGVASLCLIGMSVQVLMAAFAS
ncbi:MAG: MAPEG family protein [Deltaproteobacteria bacterium]|nr:MAPEG family protein [Deltaproteobacteria bacterium]